MRSALRDETAPKNPRPSITPVQGERLDTTWTLPRPDGSSQVGVTGSFCAKHVDRSQLPQEPRVIVMKTEAKLRVDAACEPIEQFVRLAGLDVQNVGRASEGG